MARLMVDEQALIQHLRDDSLLSILESRPPKPANKPRWYAWRPLTAAAAGLVFGALCSTVVYGFISQSQTAIHETPISVFDPGFENPSARLDRGLPHQAGEWGVNAESTIVTAENGVQPAEGQRMLRLHPRDPAEKNRVTQAYQLIDLRTLPSAEAIGLAELRLTASFAAARRDSSARYRVQAIVLAQPPDQVYEGFWEKAEEQGSVSISQKFSVPPSKPDTSPWNTISLKVPLPPAAQTLAIILGAMPPENDVQEPTVHYLDAVRVDLLTPQPVP